MNKQMIVLIFYSAIAIVLFILTTIFIQICSFADTSKAKKSDCIIVLGCRVYGSNPSPFLAGRMDEAIRLYKNNYAKYIIVSGGQGAGENISEAEAMKVYALISGVPSDKIIKEDKSTSTFENIDNSVKIMNKAGLKSAIIVSNKFHLLRSSMIAKRYNCKFSFSGVFVKNHMKSEVIGYIREVPAIIIYWFKLI